MGINGTHMLFYTSEPEKLREMLRDIFGFEHVDAGGGWLIFAMPPGEIGVHPDEGKAFESGTRHLISFMCDDITKTVEELRAKGVDVDPSTKDEGYGITTMLHLPGGCDVMLYEPRHAIAADIAPSRKKTVKKTVTKVKSKSAARRPKATARRGRQAKTVRRRR